jgi:hypothetical protein
MDKSSFWDTYLSCPPDDQRLNGGLALCRRAFTEHRAIISRMIGRFHPRSIAVLGSGYLSDIPLSDLIAHTNKVYLVDWIEGGARIGLSRSIVSGKDNHFDCLFCQVRTGRKYCRNYIGECHEKGVCSAFKLVEQPALTCGNYDPADDPVFIRADITGGVASRFAEAVEKIVAAAHTPKEALIKAIKRINSIKYNNIPLMDDSIDLVTSSMVVSQFDAEPYAFFAQLLMKRFGFDELRKHEAKLKPLVEQLRTRLFVMQVDAHVRELYRILKKDGSARAYLSSELLRSYPGGEEQYFLVQDVVKALEVVDRYFAFELDELLGDQLLSKVALGDGVSVNQNYVLVPKANPAPPPLVN